MAKVIKLIADAEITSCTNGYGTHDYYSTLAIDNYDEEYEVRWEIINPDDWDAQGQCNWSVYDVYDRYGNWIGDNSTFTVM